MKTKKYTIIVSGFLAFINLLGLLILQFRLYHIAGIYGGGNQSCIDIRAFFITVTSGVFTSSIVVLIISIREYLDERTASLRNLYRLICYVDEKYQQIHFFASLIPEEIIATYLREKYNANKFKKNWENLSDIMNEESLSQLFIKFEEAKKAYRECVWKYKDDTLKSIYKTEEDKEKYLDKQCEITENEFLSNMEEFIKSLYVFRDFDVYQIQEAFDKLDFFCHKKYKDDLEALLILYTVMPIKQIKYYLNLVSTDEDKYASSLAAVQVINHSLLKYPPARTYAYLISSYQIEFGKRYINQMLKIFGSEVKSIKAPDIERFKIFRRYTATQDFGEDILFDSWGIRN